MMTLKFKLSKEARQKLFVETGDSLPQIHSLPFDPTELDPVERLHIEPYIHRDDAYHPKAISVNIAHADCVSPERVKHRPAHQLHTIVFKASQRVIEADGTINPTLVIQEFSDAVTDAEVNTIHQANQYLENGEYIGTKKAPSWFPYEAGDPERRDMDDYFTSLRRNAETLVRERMESNDPLAEGPITASLMQHRDYDFTGLEIRVESYNTYLTELTERRDAARQAAEQDAWAKLAGWAKHHGSELLRARIEQGIRLGKDFNWKELALEEYTRAILEPAHGYDPTDDDITYDEDRPGPDPEHDAWAIGSPTLAQIDYLRRVHMDDRIRSGDPAKLRFDLQRMHFGACPDEGTFDLVRAEAQIGSVTVTRYYKLPEAVQAD